MNPLLRWLRRRRQSRAAVVCYLRENGPIAYGLALFDPDPRPRVDAMFESGLAWYWRAADASGASSSREWTQVTRWSSAALLADLAPPASAEARDIALIGIDAGDAPAAVADDQVLPWLRDFVSDTPGPLHVVVRVRPDFVFVAQQPPEAVRALLQAWEIDRARAERRAYARLDRQSLEQWLRSLRPGRVPHPPG